MSEGDRQRRLHVENRLEELRAKLGPLEEVEPESREMDPSWGPVGSLAQARMDPAAYAHLLALHNDMLATERARKKAAEDDSQVLHPSRSRAVATPRTPT